MDLEQQVSTLWVICSNQICSAKFMRHDGRSITIYVIFTIRAATIPECSCMGFVGRKFIELCLTKQKHSLRRVFLFGVSSIRALQQR